MRQTLRKRAIRQRLRHQFPAQTLSRFRQPNRCDAWNTRPFFETATVEEVTACLTDECPRTPLHNLHNQFEPTAWHINLAVEGASGTSRSVDSRLRTTMNSIVQAVLPGVVAGVLAAAVSSFGALHVTRTAIVEEAQTTALIAAFSDFTRSMSEVDRDPLLTDSITRLAAHGDQGVVTALADLAEADDGFAKAFVALLGAVQDQVGVKRTDEEVATRLFTAFVDSQWCRVTPLPQPPSPPPPGP